MEKMKWAPSEAPVNSVKHILLATQSGLMKWNFHLVRSFPVTVGLDIKKKSYDEPKIFHLFPIIMIMMFNKFMIPLIPGLSKVFIDEHSQTAFCNDAQLEHINTWV